MWLLWNWDEKDKFEEHSTRVHGKNIHLKDRHETEGEPEHETESSNMASFVRALSETTDKIKHDVNLAKEEVLAKLKTQSGIRKQKIPHTGDKPSLERCG